ncbi:hypothetical protein [Maridesulfovibrio hydrothermalis]|uniref:Mpv17 / PMP22 family protein n=1 Tax=Maridesulfovibrio hydrothermalis AM13 = DSM 14728 TaxID=1121451 RepID=L0REB1_9BACT|nr:hypothetical protein [Maridesulfovibrio hydrothermalis]CCO25133.1 conserved membrane protein of unknown function [Maridesulfovibrio hydrothermalis AM13 = DSM 14728]
MNRSDYKVFTAVLLICVSFALIPDLRKLFAYGNMNHAYLMSFIKFAVLATFGECLALRIVEGVYWKPGFGLIPKMVVWGFLGIGIKTAFSIFAAGTPATLASFGLPVSDGTNFFTKVLPAFGISTFMNCIFAPVFMTLHRITDGHIHENGGSIKAFHTPINMAKQLRAIDWDIMWNFVFKKTIPLFWIPAHTITFMLPADFRILFAALLGVALGVILALAKHKS